MQNKYRFVVGSLEKSNGFNNGTNKKLPKNMIHVGMPLYVCREGDK